ncbi:gamma-glutamyl-gamma-aminobutyrate hydrolase family protein [Legionella gresilensis]|uniref:gamma-glutamyl-gamma-aminobutyrate hydrolase family protein n=1 Tax=Legionella gresilensis TaxID=91823 RepID=UPI0010416A1F|nr:gamma-glutamyl-gamma-aminobutyrate hydrolase family protein [Legionella gresilensis]
MSKIKVAVTDSPEVGSRSAPSLKKSFASVNCDVVDADFRVMMRDIPKEVFEEAYKTKEGRKKLFLHAKYMATKILDKVDCLALSGNVAMIDPSLFNKLPDTDNNFTYDLSRTIAELALVHVATQRGMPIMGICGGYEAIAVYYDSTLRSLTPAELKQQGYMAYDKIIFNTQSILGQLFNPDEKPLSSNSPTVVGNFFGAHKQIVDKLKPSYLKVTGRASDGKLIEAIEGKYGAPLIGMQFHPEITIHGVFPNASDMGPESEKKISLKLFHFFFKAAETYNNKKRVNNLLKKVTSVFSEVTPNIEKDPIRVKNSIKENNKATIKGHRLSVVKAESIGQDNTPSKTLLNNPAIFWQGKKRLYSELDNVQCNQVVLANTM